MHFEWELGIYLIYFVAREGPNNKMNPIQSEWAYIVERPSGHGKGEGHTPLAVCIPWGATVGCAVG